MHMNLEWLLWPCHSNFPMLIQATQFWNKGLKGVTRILNWHSPMLPHAILTHWDQATHIYVGKLTTIGSDNGLSPGQRQAVIWTIAGILLIWPLGTNFSEILIAIQTFSLKKMHLKISSAKWRPFCLGLNVLTLLGLKLEHARRNRVTISNNVGGIAGNSHIIHSKMWILKIFLDISNIVKSHKLCCIRGTQSTSQEPVLYRYRTQPSLCLQMP